VKCYDLRDRLLKGSKHFVRQLSVPSGTGASKRGAMSVQCFSQPFMHILCLRSTCTAGMSASSDAAGPPDSSLGAALATSAEMMPMVLEVFPVPGGPCKRTHSLKSLCCTSRRRANKSRAGFALQGTVQA
jgi:hypothetical protein